MKLTFLGSGDAFCSSGRFQTCFYVEGNETKFLIDCGATSLLAIKQQNINISEIDVIFITHQHGDHYGGLPFIIIDSMYESKRNKPLVIASAIPQFEKKVKDLLELLYPGFGGRDFGFTLLFQYLEKERSNHVHHINAEVYPVIHSDAAFSHAIKLEVDGKIIAYSGDTEWTDILYQVADNADLFICECNFYESDIPGHMNYKELKDKSEAFNCKRIVLNHPGNEFLKNQHKVDLKLATDGMEIHL